MNILISGAYYPGNTQALAVSGKKRVIPVLSSTMLKSQNKAFPWTGRKPKNVDNKASCLIDLFSLYVLFSHFRPRDATRGNSFFQMSSYARANVRITNAKKKRKIPMRASRGLKWENKMYKLKRSIQGV